MCLSVPDFLFMICSVLNCRVVLRHPTKTEVLRMCCGGLRIPGDVTESERSRSRWKRAHWLELKRVSSAAVLKRRRTHIWWNLEVRLYHVTPKNEEKWTLSFTVCSALSSPPFCYQLIAFLGLYLEHLAFYLFMQTNHVWLTAHPHCSLKISTGSHCSWEIPALTLYLYCNARLI